MILIDNNQLNIFAPETGNKLVDVATKELSKFYDEYRKKIFPLYLKRHTGDRLDDAGNQNPDRFIAYYFSTISFVSKELGNHRWIYSKVPWGIETPVPHSELLPETITLVEEDWERAFFLLKKSGLVGSRGHYTLVDPVEDANNFAESQANMSYVNTMLYAKELSPLFGPDGEFKVRTLATALGIPMVKNMSLNQVKKRILEYTEAFDIATIDRRAVSNERAVEFKELLNAGDDLNVRLRYLIQKAEDDRVLVYDTMSHEYSITSGSGSARLFFTNKSYSAELRQRDLAAVLKNNKTKLDTLLEAMGEPLEPDKIVEVSEDTIREVMADMEAKGGIKDAKYAQVKSWAKKIGLNDSKGFSEMKADIADLVAQYA